jgi:hypothetical protein
LNVGVISREVELAAGHVVDAGNITNRSGVARASLNLLAIRKGLADAEIDEVVAVMESTARSIRKRTG